MEEYNLFAEKSAKLYNFIRVVASPYRCFLKYLGNCMEIGLCMIWIQLFIKQQSKKIVGGFPLSNSLEVSSRKN